MMSSRTTHRVMMIGAAMLLAGMVAVTLAGCAEGFGCGWGGDWAGCESRGGVSSSGMNCTGLQGSDPFVLAVLGGFLLIEAIWSACSRCR